MFDHLQSLVWLNNRNQFLLSIFQIISQTQGKKECICITLKHFSVFSQEYIEVSEDHGIPFSTIFNADLVLVDV